MYETALRLIRKIEEYGFKAYIVGGYPRDLYLNRESVDIDICTSATPKDVKEIFSGSILPRQEYGGVTVISNNIRFEITTFRKEIKYENNRFPVKIKYIDTLIDDLERRDFTINTLCIDCDGNTIDLLNAKKDLDEKVIRCVGNTDKKIKEDILRSLRAIRFATILDFKLDKNLKKTIRKYGHLLKRLSYYRKKEELEKIFASSNCQYGLQLIKELKLVKFLELSNFDNLVVTTSSLAMWAQLDVLDIYSFTSNEKKTIIDIQEVLKKEAIDNYTLYKYDLYVCTLAGEIKGLDRANLVKQYTNLPISNKKDIAIKSDEICKILNKSPGLFLKDIYKDLEYKVLNNELMNEKDSLKKYIETLK